MEYLTYSVEIIGAIALGGAALVGLMFRRFEVVAGVAVILAGTAYHAMIVDRWGETNVTAEQFSQRFKDVPLDIADWKGEDQVVTDDVKKMAGAVGHISRVYTNEVTGKKVSVWLAIGHARDICRHSPTSCYPSQGLRQQDDEISFPMPVENGHENNFWTAVFKGETGSEANHPKRVFWAWASNDKPDWVAPKYQRIKFRNTRAMYKLYFTSLVYRDEKTARDSPCVDFAELFIPIVNQSLFSDRSAAEEATDTDGAAQAPVEESDPATP